MNSINKVGSNFEDLNHRLDVIEKKIDDVNWYNKVAEYRKRSPAWQVGKYRNTPLLIHTNTNDEDVNVLEVEHLIKSLKAEGNGRQKKVKIFPITCYL